MVKKNRPPPTPTPWGQTHQAFDKDGEGKLNEEEGRAARKALQRK
ncbi:MAG: hypothetical protein CM1200mP2_31270 [Planctomycetaceae bacterium]|nr:MAG: hypothetical protein CM1200mP2_31270 [Planctomycetaceae bacterium]